MNKWIDYLIDKPDEQPQSKEGDKRAEWNSRATLTNPEKNVAHKEDRKDRSGNGKNIAYCKERTLDTRTQHRQHSSSSEYRRIPCKYARSHSLTQCQSRRTCINQSIEINKSINSHHKCTRHKSTSIRWREESETREHWIIHEYFKYPAEINVQSVTQVMSKICAPDPTMTDRRSARRGGLKTSPWTNFQPNSSWASSCRSINK